MIDALGETIATVIVGVICGLIYLIPWAVAIFLAVKFVKWAWGA